MLSDKVFSPDCPFSVIIITLNEEKNIGNLLDDLVAQTYKNFEVLVVDSNSEDRTVEIAQSYQDRLNLRTIVMKNRGTSLGRNTGAENASNERLVFFDADVRIQPDFLRKSLDLLIKKRLLISAGQMTCNEADALNRFGIWLFNLAMIFTQYFFPTCAGACIFSTKTVHNLINGFDTRIKLCEDCDYANRASKTFRFRMISSYYAFHTRRLKQDGIFKIGGVYLKANLMRFFKGELTHDEIDYPFDHYKK